MVQNYSSELSARYLLGGNDVAEPGGTRALENSGNYTTERGGNDRAEMGWKLTTEPGWIKNRIRTEKTGRKCSQRDYPHEQLCRVAMFKKTYLFWLRNDLTSACVADRMITKKRLLLNEIFIFNNIVVFQTYSTDNRPVHPESSLK